MKAVIRLIACLLLCLCAVSALADVEGDFVYSIFDGAAEITDYTGSASKLTIPSKLGGAPVTEIQYNAFRDCVSLTSVVVPEGVTSVGEWAFGGCVNLAEIDLPDSLTSLGAAAFYECASLVSVEIPAGVKQIGNSLFQYCAALTSVKIPVGITKVGDYAFNGCEKLVSADLPEGVKEIGEYAFASCGSLASVNLPQTLTKIGPWAFSGCRSLAAADVPDGVTALGEGVFYDCASLAQLELPSALTEIGDSAFAGCAGLSLVVLPDSLLSMGAYAFNECAALTEINLPAGMTNIGEYALSGCKSLVSVVIPDAVKDIPGNLLSYCSALTSVTFPGGMTSIGSGVFTGCSKLEKVYVAAIEDWLNVEFKNQYANPMLHADKLYVGGELLTHAVVPEGKTSLESRFRNCSSLVSIEIPGSVTSIGNYEFSGCASLKTIVIPRGVSGIGNRAFEGCESLVSVSIPDSVTSIGEAAFRYCESLSMVSIPAGVKNLSKRIFSGCTALVSVDLKNGLVSIGDEAFIDCTVLNTLYLPEGLETIGTNAFENCGLYSLTIPTTVTAITRPLVESCDNLISVIMPKELVEIVDDAFPDYVTKIYCYKGSAADEWAQRTGREPVYLDEYDIEQDLELIAPGMGEGAYVYDSVFEVGRPLAWKKGYSVSPQPAGKTYTFSCVSSDPSIALVNGDYVEFLKDGKATLTVSVNELPELSVTVPIDVYYPVESFEFPGTIFMPQGSGYQGYEVTSVTPENANPYFVAQASSGQFYLFNKSAEELHHSVWLWPDRNLGKQTMRAYPCSFNYYEHYVEWDKEPYEQFDLVTYKTVNSIAAEAPDGALEIGERYLPGIVVKVDDQPYVQVPESYTLKSSDTGVVRVMEGGRLLALAPGKATIEATTFAGNKVAKFNVTVADVTSLELPANLTEIRAEAFAGMAAGGVEIPGGCLTVGSRAFADCPNLRRVVFPASVTEIAEDVFEGCSEHFLIVAPEGSYAAEFAAAHGYAVLYAE